MQQSKTGRPPFVRKTQPFSSLEALDQEGGVLDSWSISGIPLCCQGAGRRRTRLLVCHDMKGGYHEDAWVQGDFRVNQSQTNAPSLLPSAGFVDVPPYTFQHWLRTDIFIYFSHHRVSIPPVSWTSAAHRNGTVILGTVITEWEQGKADNDRLVRGPPSPSPTSCTKWSPHYADRLVDLAIAYNFDGWFINVESDFLQLESTPQDLVQWLQYLTARMHQRKPGSMVIWYDSLTVDGEVKWQNKLNDRNAAFFQATDGIFTNYTWKESDLMVSVETALRYPSDRKWDVFTGNDLWGRGTFGGGGFDVDKALAVIERAETSIALFAPAWTHETLPDGVDFQQHDSRLWYDDQKGIANFVEARTYHGNSLHTTFDRGFGEKVFLQGKLVFSGRWHHMGMTSLLPDWQQQTRFSRIVNMGTAESTLAEGLRWRPTSQFAFNGGTALQVEYEAANRSPGTYLSPLFSTKISVPSEGIIVRYVVYLANPNAKLGLYVRCGTGYRFFPVPEPTRAVNHAESTLPWKLFSSMISPEDRNVPTCIDEVGMYVEVGGELEGKGPLLVGYIGMISLYPKAWENRETYHVHNIRISDVRECQEDEEEVRWITLEWDVTCQDAMPSRDSKDVYIDHYLVFLGEEWLGYALTTRFQWILRNQGSPSLQDLQRQLCVVPVDNLGRQHH